MTRRRGPLHITAEQVIRVRKTLRETQAEFSDRFYRSRYAIIRWEQNGVKFQYKSIRYQVWRAASFEAIRQTKLNFKGTENEQIENLRILRLFPG